MGQDPESKESYTAKGVDRLERWYSRIPNLVDDLGLSPYAFRLYAHLKRVAGDDGSCYQSRDTLAKICKMSAGQVTVAKQELIASRLIDVTRGQAGYHSDVIKIIDIWKRNFVLYISATRPGDDRVNEDSTTRSGDDGTRSGDDGTRSGDDGTRSGDDGTRSGDDGTRSGDDTKNDSLRITPEEDILHARQKIDILQTGIENPAVPPIPPDPFTEMQSMIERMTGYPALLKDIPAIQEFVNRGVIEVDIEGAIAFLAGNNKTARGADQMQNCVFLELAKRTQAAIAKNSNRKPKRKSISDIAKEHAAAKKEHSESPPENFEFSQRTYVSDEERTASFQRINRMREELSK